MRSGRESRQGDPAYGRSLDSSRSASRTARKCRATLQPSTSTKNAWRMIDRYAQYALVAAREAVAMSGRSHFSAIVTGCSAGGQDAMDAGFVDLYQKALPRVNPMMVPRVMSSGAASHMAMEFGVKGPVYSVSTACSSANHAMARRSTWFETACARAAIAGGCEAVFSYGFLKAWEAMRSYLRIHAGHSPETAKD